MISKEPRGWPLRRVGRGTQGQLTGPGCARTTPTPLAPTAARCPLQERRPGTCLPAGRGEEGRVLKLRSLHSHGPKFWKVPHFPTVCPFSQCLAEAAPLSSALQALGQGAGEGGWRKTCVMEQSAEVGVGLSLPVESHCADAGCQEVYGFFIF